MADARANGIVSGEVNSFADTALIDALKSVSADKAQFRPTPGIGNDNDPTLRGRDTHQVLEDHLRLRLEGRLEEDLQRNYAPDVVLLTVNSNSKGHHAIRMSAKRLAEQLPDADFEFVMKQVSGSFALLVWKARSPRQEAHSGADTFVIENGLIRLQTIHYHLTAE
ncbi:hypothetical protein [Mesorhizobium retamae]|uniref:SnoaL-like domain-containing protein n=1 Tax=Mesorhizobium retamae TaxID=2912854 RepID=A0ABS9QLV7_9HYPH|nr:hypothetical protein [Mesorhizobium sp. IRAMC:0171]MCG7508406.1 hypothetical protein [Mesorhizobium sp. IRAMC:0171]